MERIAGQPRAIEILQSQLASGRLHHAYIFHGPAGVGKFTTALEFARVLLCHQPESDLAGNLVPCRNCPSCRLLAEPDVEDADTPAALASAHPDLHVIAKELARYSDSRLVRERKLTQIPVELLRDTVLEPVGRASQLQHGKVFIVDEAELLNPAGQNLLLKTLEEPPAGTTIILITASEDRLLPTIRSRCQRVAFVPLADEVIRRWLGERVPTLDEQQTQWLLAFAGGSLGRAKLAMDYELSEWAQRVLPAVDELARDRPQGELGQAIAERIDGFAKAWVEAHAGASKEAANKLAADLMGSMIAGHARRRLAEAAERCPAGDPEAGEVQVEPWLRVIEAVGEMQRMLASNVNLSLSCDYLVTRMQRGLATGAG